MCCGVPLSPLPPNTLTQDVRLNSKLTCTHSHTLTTHNKHIIPTPPDASHYTSLHGITRQYTALRANTRANTRAKAYDYGPEWDARLRSECEMQKKKGGGAVASGDIVLRRGIHVDAQYDQR
jgi:hypothetical protein